MGKNWIAKSLDSSGRERKGRVRTYVARVVGQSAFDRHGRLKPSAEKRAKKIARREGNASMEDAIDESLTLRKLGLKREKNKDPERRRTSVLQRKTASKNAIRGTREWENMSHGDRVRARNRKSYSWGFEGNSPRTKDRKHAHR